MIFVSSLWDSERYVCCWYTEAELADERKENDGNCIRRTAVLAVAELVLAYVFAYLGDCSVRARVCA